MSTQPIIQRPPSAGSTISRPADSSHLYLYHEDLPENRRIPNLLSAIVNLDNNPNNNNNNADPLLDNYNTNNTEFYTGQQQQGPYAAIDYRGESTNNNQSSAANHHQQQHHDNSLHNKGRHLQTPPTPTHTLSGDTSTSTAKANLGTLSGVYFPCVQNIFGVILFIRMVWIVGTAGVPAAFTLVFICCCVTLCTSISLSAIATNGIVPAGGSYFMISRSLGPEFGGAVGTLFFLGTTVAGAMYTTGAVEIMLNYMSPQLGLFGDFQRDVGVLYNNIRVYGTLLLILIGCMVLIGVKFVSRLAPVALFCVLFSIACIYTGIFINYEGKPDLMICVVGDRLVTVKNLPYNETAFIDTTTGSDQQSQQQQQQRSLGPFPVYNPSPLPVLAANTPKSPLTPSEMALRKMKALCNVETLKQIYCNESRTITNNNNRQQQFKSNNYDFMQQPQQQQQQQQAQIGSGNDTGNLDGCDPYFSANAHRIHLEKAVPGKLTRQCRPFPQANVQFFAFS